MGMEYRALVAVLEPFEGLRFGCKDPARPEYPPCRALDVGSSSGSGDYGFSIDVGPDGKITRLGSLEYRE
jgi:hypothetical protein